MIKRAPFIWDGACFRPISKKMLDCLTSELKDGERYHIDIIHERSKKSHNHYFSMISEMWNSLPESLDGVFKTPEHLRKRALIELGYYKETSIVVDSEDQAEYIAKFIKAFDEYAVVSVSGPFIIRRDAKSQSMKEMGKAAFQKSKSEVLEYIQNLIGVE